MDSIQAALVIINELSRRAKSERRSTRPRITDAPLRCLLANWEAVEHAGATFTEDGVIVDGVRFKLETLPAQKLCSSARDDAV